MNTFSFYRPNYDTYHVTRIDITSIVMFDRAIRLRLKKKEEEILLNTFKHLYKLNCTVNSENMFIHELT